MDQSLPLGDSVPAISVTSPGPSDPTSSPATLEALDDSRLAPIPPLPKASPDQRQIFTNPSIPRPVPLSVIDHSLPAYNKQFRFFSERTNFLDTRNNFSRCGIRHGACHAHSPTTFAGNEEGKDKEETGKPNDEGVEAKRNKPQKEAIPSFSSPWAPSSCSPKRVLWKEVEDYNRQRKRVRFLGWAGVENPWETEASSTVCSEGSDCSDSDGSFGQTKSFDVPAEDSTMVAGEGTEGVERKWEVGNYEGIKVVITTSKDGKTTTTLKAGPHAKLEKDVEIVTKTVVRGNEVTTITTTTLIPLAGMNSKSVAGD
jgi:hypothetical protein